MALTISMLVCSYVTMAQGVDAVRMETTYYVSSSRGNDKNDGLTEKSAKQHISAIGLKKNIRIRLKRGDLFFEQIIGYDNCIIEDYGRGEKPVLCGFKVLINPQAWVYDNHDGLWKIDMFEESNFAGCLHGNVADSCINNVGFIYNPNSDRLYGRRVKETKDISEYGQFCISYQNLKGPSKSEVFRWLSWKYDGDPRRIKRLCFPMWLIGIRDLNNCEVRNIAIVGFNFGVVVCNGTVFDNCQIDLIGGSVISGGKNWVRYGNGIEFSWGNHDNLIKNCLISRTYDCGATIQSSGNFRGSPKNIHFRGNRFYHCRQAFEFFLNASNDYKPQYINCSFSGNICYEMGKNEFSSPAQSDASLLSYDNFSKQVSIERNTFFGAPYYCGAVYPDGLSDNTVYIYKGQFLYNYHGLRTMPVVIAHGDEDIVEYGKLSGDNSKIFIMEQCSRFAKQTRRKIRKQVGWKTVDLKLGRRSF